MSKHGFEARGSKAEQTDRIAREIINAERSHRDRKTTRLRDMRIKAQQIVGS